MKESLTELAHGKNLPPSLKDALKERFGRVTTTWQIEHARVLHSLERAGLSGEASRTLANFINLQAKVAGLSAVATDLLIGGTIAGVGAALLTRPNPVKITAGLLEIESKNLTKALGLGAEAAAVGAVWMGPVQQASRLWARMYGSATESMIDSVRLVQDHVRSIDKRKA